MFVAFRAQNDLAGFVSYPNIHMMRNGGKSYHLLGDFSDVRVELDNCSQKKTRNLWIARCFHKYNIMRYSFWACKDQTRRF